MNRIELKQRTQKFALEIIKFVMEIPYLKNVNTICIQLLKSGTSIGANYRSACRAQSHKHFISKLSIAEEEADETVYWLELLKEIKITDDKEIKNLLKEAKELTAIFTSARRTARQREISKISGL